MRIRKALEDFLIDFNLSEENNGPLMENYFTREKCTHCRTLYGYLSFLQNMLEIYHKGRHLESFEDFVNNIYPPQEKNTCSEDADD